MNIQILDPKGNQDKNVDIIRNFKVAKQFGDETSLTDSSWKITSYADKLLERAESAHSAWSIHIHNALKALTSNNVVDKDNSGPQIQGMETKAQLTSVTLLLFCLKNQILKAA